jgi:hypothetical protein
MDDLSKQQMKQTQDILIKLTGGSMSTSDYDSNTMGFFAPDDKRKPFEIGFKDNPEMPEGLNHNIQRMHKIIGDPDKEVYIGYWTILSLNQVLDRFKKLKDKNQKRVFDIALRYTGMGHVDILSCDLQTHKLFIRHDGGANGWERQANRDALLTLDPTTLKQMFFHEWFNTCEKTFT